jgi:hypothetical protein
MCGASPKNLDASHGIVKAIPELNAKHDANISVNILISHGNGFAGYFGPADTKVFSIAGKSIEACIQKNHSLPSNNESQIYVSEETQDIWKYLNVAKMEIKSNFNIYKIL